MSLWIYTAPTLTVPDIVPMPKMDTNGGQEGVTSTSFVVAFDIVPALEVNGPVDK